MMHVSSFLYRQAVNVDETGVSLPTRDDVRGWSAQQRAGVAQLLAEHIDQSPATMRSPGRRRLVLSVGGIGALFLLPWLVFLSATLPAHSSGGAWRAVWVGFDVALVAAFVATVLATSAALLMRRSFTVIARLRGQDPTPVPLWRQSMIHFASTRLEQEDDSAYHG